MSWVAHDLEPYVFQRKLWKGAAGISFVALVIGSWGPDMATKWLAYGTNVAGLHFKADNPVQFHRGWPGAGFTHSLTFGLVVAAIVYALSRNKPWSLGLLIGIWMHALSDSGDTVGAMLFFPWTHHFALGAWRYTTGLGRLEDAAAYYSGPGFVWDSFWVVAALLSWRVLQRSYFHERIAPTTVSGRGAAGCCRSTRWWPSTGGRSSSVSAGSPPGCSGRTFSTTTRSTRRGAGRTGLRSHDPDVSALAPCYRRRQQ
ncbi:MAG TPA: metal-dependent hydrolase [Gaiellaceae bacterium]|nr:metal-dependent hydrolase [Gaiellaceae bacterium]